MENDEYVQAPRWRVLATMVGLCLKAGDTLAAEGHMLELLALMAFRSDYDVPDAPPPKAA